VTQARTTPPGPCGPRFAVAVDHPLGPGRYGRAGEGGNAVDATIAAAAVAWSPSPIARTWAAIPTLIWHRDSAVSASTQAARRNATAGPRRRHPASAARQHRPGLVDSWVTAQTPQHAPAGGAAGAAIRLGRDGFPISLHLSTR
jgi:gamma-glutamyltranspeptidase